MTEEEARAEVVQAATENCIAIMQWQASGRADDAPTFYAAMKPALDRYRQAVLAGARTETVPSICIACGDRVVTWDSHQCRRLHE